MSKRSIQRLFVFGRNTWYYITERKLFLLIVIWSYNYLQRIIIIIIIIIIAGFSRHSHVFVSLFVFFDFHPMVCREGKIHSTAGSLFSFFFSFFVNYHLISSLLFYSLRVSLVFRTLLSILAVLYNAVDWMVTARPLISKFLKPRFQDFRDRSERTNYNWSLSFSLSLSLFSQIFLFSSKIQVFVFPFDFFDFYSVFPFFFFSFFPFLSLFFF